MAAFNINRVGIFLVLILICDIQCNTNDGNNGNNKLLQSSEKDSKVSQHENDGEKKVDLDESGIHVNPKPSHDNLNVEHVSSHDVKGPLKSPLSDQGDRETSSKSQPIDTIDSVNHVPNSNTGSPSSVVSPNELNDVSPDKVEIKNDIDSIEVDNEEILFEEFGGPDESLVDQMKRLSEKIKEGQEKESVEMEIPDELKETDAMLQTEEINVLAEEFHDNVKLDSEAGLKTDNTGAKVEMEHEIFDGEIVKSNQENVESDRDNLQHNDLDIKVHETEQIIETEVEQNVEQDYKETVMEQIKKLEKEAMERESDVPSLVPSYGTEDFPSEEELDEADSKDNVYNYQDILGKSNDQIGKPSSEVVIDNTQPPASDIIPSKTDQYFNEQNKLPTEQIQLRPTPSLEDVKSTVHTLSQIDVTEQIQATAKVDMKSTKKILNAQERKNMRLAKNKKQIDINTDEKQIPAPVKTNVNPTPVFDVNVNTNQPKIMKKEVTASVDVNAATDHENIQTMVDELETSENDITGTVYDTNVLKEAFVQETVSAKTTDTVENLAPTTTTENKVPVVTETLPPHGQDSQTQSQEEIQSSSSSSSSPSSSETVEETPEEKEKMAQAQQYFEEGEKLINNSYKKDYIQAYEYFHLAADLGHSKALEYLGFGHLLGDYVTLDPAKALKLFQDLSEKGSPKGQLGLGFSYSSGLAVNSSQAKALIYFTFAALGGDPWAQMVLGYRFLSGIGVESKCETALTYYRKVATTVAESTSSGSPVVQRIRLHEQADNKESSVGSLMDDDLLQYYEFLADKGDVQAQVVLGQLYYQGGRGVPVNHERAQHYFLMASESGNGNAFAFLGKMHSEGSPLVPQDDELAYQYFKKAADKGNPIGQCGLGIVHLYGKGVEKDYQKALKYFTLSSDQGWSDAQLHLGIMHFGGKGVRRDYKVAVKYFNLASQGGHVLAFYHLAQMHATGTGVLRNCHTAVELYKNVAERGKWASMLVEAHDLYKNGNVNEALLKYTFLAEMGYEVAQTNVAFILDNGESTLFDQTETYQRALLHWTRAASQGSSTVARLKMGDYHYYGYGTDIDYETAATHYRLATEQQHNAQAMFNLGYMHENGLGLKQDVHLAKRFYDMAAETSGDAYVPVTLALFKLGMFYGTDVFNKEMENYYTFFNKLDIRYQLGPYWDIYLATFLAIALGIVVVVFRHHR